MLKWLDELVKLLFLGDDFAFTDHSYPAKQLVEKDPDAAIALFWKAINGGDRIDSALKDMAVVMKQQDRTEEAIGAIKSFRGRCSKQAQESLDNILIGLYKVL